HRLRGGRPRGRSGRPAGRLTRSGAPPILRATSRRTGCERDEYPSRVGREIRWLVETGAAAAGNGPGSLRTQRRASRDDEIGPWRDPSRLRRRAPAIQGSADRRGPRERTAARRSRSAASPNEGGTAEGTTFRPGTN